MSQGTVMKDYRPSLSEEEELQLVNGYTRRPMTAEEVYLFTVALCDNDIDRDYERFTRDALDGLARLFVGKTGIFNHSMKSEDQTARLFFCRVEDVPGRVTRAGEPYARLVARAYLPRTDKNRELIEEIDSGIKKEVSISCAVGRVACSVCGADLRAGGCDHQKGRIYHGKPCHAVLSEPTDAYEWSFVAVPAQREAGVLKQYIPQPEKEECCVQEIVKQLRAGEALTAEQVGAIQDAWREMEELAGDGRAYREELRRDVVRMSAIVQPELQPGLMEALTKKMSLTELQQFRKAYRAREQGCPVPQLAHAGKESDPTDNQPYCI